MSVITTPKPTAPASPLTVAKKQVKANRAKYTPRAGGTFIMDRLDPEVVAKLSAIGR